MTVLGYSRELRDRDNVSISSNCSSKGVKGGPLHEICVSTLACVSQET